MNRRQIMLASAAALAAAWSGRPVPAEERIDASLVTALPNAKITLQQALTAAAQHGQAEPGYYPA